MTIETLWKAFGWFWLGWWVSAGLMVLLLQLLLPRAWEAIRAAPPHGPAWAQTLWYGRTRVYGGIMALALLIGALAAAGHLLL